MDNSLFQSTHPSGVRPSTIADHYPYENFNPRTPVGCDSPALDLQYGDEQFQSTHPSGVRQPASITPNIIRQFQSTHPSGVRHSRDLGEIVRIVISIHAPQWGATRRRHGLRLGQGNFNPRTPVGCDAGFSWTHRLAVISIHAPQWGATAITPFTSGSMVFQSTHPSGVRPCGLPKRL